MALVGAHPPSAVLPCARVDQAVCCVLCAVCHAQVEVEPATSRSLGGSAQCCPRQPQLSANQ